MKNLDVWAFINIKKYYLKYSQRYINDYDNLEDVLNINNYFGFLALSFLIGFSMTIPPILFEIFFNVFSYFNIITFLIFILLLIIFGFIEFYLLYLLGFKLIAIWGIKIFGIEKEYIISSQKNFIQSLTRVIMELPEAQIKHKYYLNPYEYSKSSKLLFISLIYKIKVFASNFIAKIILKKILIRSFFRWYVSLIAAPITGFWDVFIFFRVMKISKFRILERLLINRMLIKNERFLNMESVQKIILMRYYFYGEYNVNLDYMLSKTNSLRSNISKEEIYNYESYINKSNKKILIVLLSFKYKMFNEKEKELINLFSLKDDIVNIKKLIHKSDIESIYNFIYLND